MKEPDFGQGSLLAFWNSLTDSQRQELVKNLEAFHALVSSLKGRGIVYTDKNISTITVIKKSPEIKTLKGILAKIGTKGIKIVDKEELRSKKSPRRRAGA